MTLTTTITNTGGSGKDTLDYGSLGASSGLSNTISSPITGTSSGGPVANNGGTASVGQTYTAVNTGTDTITNTGTTGINATLGGSATDSGNTGTTIVVYSGQGTWTGGSAAWGSPTASPGNWTMPGGVPGLAGAPFNNTDSATFGNNTGTVNVSLGGVSPSLNTVTFDNTTSGSTYNITPTGGGTLHLDGNTGSPVTANITDTAGSNTISAPVEFDTAAAASVARSTDTLTISGAISEAGGHQSFTVTGPGSVVLSNAGGNNYSGGTTVGSGSDSPTLLLTNGHTSGGSATGTGPLTVNAGATIGGDGTSRSSSFAINGNVMVGNGTDSTSQTTITGATASTFTNANLTFNLNTANTNSNVLNVGNTAITFSNTTLTLNLQGGQIIGNGTQYTLIAGTGTNQYSGFTTFTNDLQQLQIQTGGGLTLAFSNGQSEAYYMPSYLFLSGDNIVVEVVPEPSTWAMMIGGLAVLVIYQRRKST